METKEKTSVRKERETIFSKCSLFELEWLINWFFDEFESMYMTKCLMHMLESYIETCSKNEAMNITESDPDFRPVKMVSVVSQFIQLYERLREIVNREEVWDWELDDNESYWDKFEKKIILWKKITPKCYKAVKSVNKPLIS